MIVLYTILITDEYRNIALTSISPDTFCTCVRNHVEILTWMKLENPHVILAIFGTTPNFYEVVALLSRSFLAVYARTLERCIFIVQPNSFCIK